MKRFTDARMTDANLQQKGTHLAVEMFLEKRHNPTPRIFRCCFVVPDINHSQCLEPPRSEVVQERVTRLRFPSRRALCLRSLTSVLISAPLLGSSNPPEL
jgi:hypothetical protein